MSNINIKYLKKQAYIASDAEFVECVSLYKKIHKHIMNSSHLNSLVRKVKKKRKLVYKQKNLKSDKVSKYIKKENELLNYLYPKRKTKWIAVSKRKKRSLHSQNIENFSLIDAPVETVQNLYLLAKQETRCSINCYDLNFKDSTIYDIAPYIILEDMMNEMVPFVRGGIIHRHLSQVIKALKLDGYLNTNAEVVDKNISAMELMKKEYDNKNDPVDIDKRDVVASKMCKKFNEWLDRLDPEIKLKLSDKGERTFLNIIGEVLENAEKHAYPDKGSHAGKWSVSCFMEFDKNNNSHKCCLSFFNKGQTIAQTIQNTTNIKTKQELSRYLEKHKHIDKDLLSTVFALQDWNSRENTSDSRGGLGMMHMVHFIQEIGKNVDAEKQPKIVILSGRSYVKFSGKYMNTNYDNTGKRYQWFNTENSSLVAPDNNNVFCLHSGIAGTIVTSRFYLDRGMLIHG